VDAKVKNSIGWNDEFLSQGRRIPEKQRKDVKGEAEDEVSFVAYFDGLVPKVIGRFASNR